MCAAAVVQGTYCGGSTSSGTAARSTGEDNTSDVDVMPNCVSRSISFSRCATEATRTFSRKLSSPVQRWHSCTSGSDAQSFTSRRAAAYVPARRMRMKASTARPAARGSTRAW